MELQTGDHGETDKNGLSWKVYNSDTNLRNFRIMDINRDPEFHKAINAFLSEHDRYQIMIKKAELFASILATEYYVCAGIGFVKYLN